MMGKISGRVVQKPTIAAAVEAVEFDDDDDDDDCEDKKGAGDADEEDEYTTATSHEETPPQCSKKQRRLHDEDVEDEDRNNCVRSTTLSTLVQSCPLKSYNELYNLLAEDRACPQAAAVEKEFLDYCVKECNKKKVGGR